MLRNKIFIVIFFIIIIIIILTGVVYVSFFSMSNLPIGEEIKRESSPDNEHMLIVYICENALSAPAIRCEVVNIYTGKARNIYWQYREEYVDILWLDNYTVSINGICLNIFRDSYDWRRK